MWIYGAKNTLFMFEWQYLVPVGTAMSTAVLGYLQLSPCARDVPSPAALGGMKPAVVLLTPISMLQ